MRHVVFIMGLAGVAKSSVWEILAAGFTILGDKCQTEIVNPRPITSNKLYGHVGEGTREWKDGLLPRIFRDLALLSKTKKNSKWIVLDGIINAGWIESMSTVMDDNEMLTLASNERIPLTASMRLVFEISHLRNSTPATVSRAGIIYINETDMCWAPYRDKWVLSHDDTKERDYLDMLFDKYVPTIMDFWKRSMKSVVPMMDIATIQTICRLLDGLLTEESCPPGGPSELYEMFFVFACIWAFGGNLPSDGRIDYRTSCSNWWKKEVPFEIKDNGSVFDYFLDETQEFVPWTTIVPELKNSREMLFSQLSVETADTIRLTYLMNLYVEHRKPVLFVGTAGTGKTKVMKNKLESLDSNEVIYRIVNFSSRTDPKTLQAILESALDNCCY